MHSFERILVALDLDERASWEQCLPIAEKLATCFNARITICSVADDTEAMANGRWWPISQEEMISKKHAELDGLRRQMRLGVPVDLEIGIGGVCNGVADIADRIGADLIILSEHQHKLARFFMDSKAERIAQKTSCSVLMVKKGPK